MPTKEQPSAPKKQSVSAFKNAKKLEAQKQRAEEIAFREKQAAENEAAYQAREEYAKELSEDHVNLIRLKQGVISEDDPAFAKQETKKHYTLFQKISNWFYHAKWWLGIAAFCVLLGGFLIYDMVTRVDPDMRILVLSGNSYLTAQEPKLCEIAQSAAEDVNDDEKVIVTTISIPLVKEIMDGASAAAQSYHTQMTVQLQSAMCMLVLADSKADECLTESENFFVDLEPLFPEYDFVSGHRAYVNDTNFAQLLGITEPLTEGTYFALRKPTENMDTLEENQAAYDQAHQVLSEILRLIANEKGAS